MVYAYYIQKYIGYSIKLAKNCIAVFTILCVMSLSFISLASTKTGNEWSYLLMKGNSTYVTKDRLFPGSECGLYFVGSYDGEYHTNHIKLWQTYWLGDRHIGTRDVDPTSVNVSFSLSPGNNNYHFDFVNNCTGAWRSDGAPDERNLNIWWTY